MIHAVPQPTSKESAPRVHVREGDEAPAVDNSQLRSYVQRASRLHEERQVIAKDIAELYDEAASNGFDKGALKQVVRISMEDPTKRQKRAQTDDAVSVYCAALGLSQ